MEQDLLARINQLKSNVQHLWHDVSDVLKEKIHKFTEDNAEEIQPIKIDNYHYESHYPDDDLPLTLAKDPEPGVHFYDTENSPASRGKPKSIPRGIDKFDDEEDEVLEEDIRRRVAVKKKRSTTATKKRQLH